MKKMITIICLIANIISLLIIAYWAYNEFYGAEKENIYYHRDKFEKSQSNYNEKVSFENHIFIYHKRGSVDVDFRGTQFFKGANFHRTKFLDSSDACFGRTVFYESANFAGSSFEGYAGFWMAKFNDTANFEGAKFLHKDGVSFNGAIFVGETNFDNAILRNANFEGAVFYKDTNFRNTIFIGKPNFNNIKIKKCYYEGSSILQSSPFKVATIK